MGKEVITIKCPLCGIHHVPVKKGSKRTLKGKFVDGQLREFNFERVNLDQNAFLSIRQAGGRGKGFKEVGRITLQEAVEKKLVPSLITSLKNQCEKILKIIE